MTTAPPEVPSSKGFWPENRSPTCEEWLRWWDTLGQSDRVLVAEHVIRTSDTAWTCVMENHRGEIAHLYDTINALSLQVRRLERQEGMKRKW